MEFPGAVDWKGKLSPTEGRVARVGRERFEAGSGVFEGGFMFCPFAYTGSRRGESMPLGVDCAMPGGVWVGLEGPREGIRF